ncbi:TraB/GumN family protein [Chitinophaga solisilvae]|uniref:TraB/GumN family protein n=1 Tax=Chitinophaga solisilvae TaxID=1233460 RepID=A0A433WKV2_9BACT|nr:TraB/GumN family protein [Chitinophaga solisilvae]NSL90183.1 TraB/GumN family protein [Chitinophaga solisilvae]
MKTLFRKIAAITFTISGLVYGQTKAQAPKDNSLLWEISGNGLDKPSYLYGTMHLMCKGDFEIREKVKTAFNNTSSVVFEANLFDPAELADATAGFRAGTPLLQRISVKDYHVVDSILKAALDPAASLKQYDSSRLSVVQSAIATKGFSCQDLMMYEYELLKMAKKTNKTVNVFEKLKEQIVYFNNAYPDSFVIAQLKKLDIKKNQLETAKMVGYYRAEGLDMLYRHITNPESMTPQEAYWILNLRNNNWIAKMPAMMQKESNFFAVGAAHLGGEKGLIAQLRAKGYQVKPILN